MEQDYWVSISNRGFFLERFQEDIDARVFPSKHNVLRGIWRGNWIITSHPESKVSQFQDVVQIKKVYKNAISGSGETTGYGEWKFTGKVVSHSLAITYAGKDASSELIGSAVLKRDNPSRLSGTWAQYTADGEVKSGTVMWEKI